MNLMPHETFTIQTQESIPVLCQKILAQIEDFSIIPNSLNQAVFTGQVSENKFKISRIIKYHNPLLPMICGRFEDIPGGTVIHVEMKLNPAVARFLYLFYGIHFGTALLILAILPLRILEFFKIISMPFSVSPGALAPLIFLTNLVTILMLPRIFRKSFWNEVKLDRSRLKQIFCEDSDVND
jgi:hypothetical protein